MYILPQPYRCPKCDHQQNYSPHDPHAAPVLSDGSPTCPKCFDRFLRENVGVMVPDA